MSGSMVWRLCVLALCALQPALSAHAAEIEVVATIKPIHSLVSRVMAGLGTPRLLVTGASSPHSFALKPSDARALAAADVFFRVSEAVEPFTGRLLGSLPPSVAVVTLADAPGIRLLEQRVEGAFEPHAHGGETHHDAGEGAPPSRDGHIWLDPDNAKAMVAEIARVLAGRFPQHAQRFRENADKVSADIDGLAAEIGRQLADVSGRPFVVFHDAYQYFERRFGLNAVGAITVSPEVQPSAKRLTEIRRRIAKLHAACVFAEPHFQPNLVSAVAEGLRLRSGTLDPEGMTVEPGPDAYFTLMRRLATGLKQCLEEPA